MTIAVWFAAILILFAEGSKLAAIAALILATILLWPRPPHSWRSTRGLPWALAVAVLAHSAWVMAIDDHWLPAATIAIAGAILYWRGVPWYHHEPELTILRTILAVMLILIGAFAYLARGFSGSSGGAGRAASAEKAADDASHGGAVGGDFVGVILIPEAQRTVTLVPPLPAMRAAVFKNPDDPPLTIPFFGVYWFYRPPDSRPPPTSITLHGKPEDLRFRSVGLAPLNMEGHQNLGKLFDTGCCSAIQVAIHNAEGRSLPAGVELVLANSSVHPEPGVLAESLGVQTVDGSEHQTLNFTMPSKGLQQFDDLTVRILRGPIFMTPSGPRMHSNSSARISIERFILVPRGRL